MVGEIRDEETAVMAIQSALTGHLVFSTLHTNDAASAVTRMLDLGIEPYLLSSSLLAVLAQRLVRRICPECAKPVPLKAWDRDFLKSTSGVIPDTLNQGSGCEVCRNTGYRGRVTVSELLVVDDKVRDRIQQHANASQIRDTAIANGMRILQLDGIEKVLRGLTTVEEVSRVTVRGGT